MHHIIDTHAHLYLEQFDEDRKEVLERASQAGVQKILLPNIDSSTTGQMLELESQYPEVCYALMGLHPCSVKDNYEEELAHVEMWLNKRDFIGIGEIGIDLYWDKSLFELQKKAFVKQINWAKDLKKPIVIHARSSTSEIIEILQKEKNDELKGIFHCFSGTKEEAQKIIDLGFLLGIGGVFTFKNSGLFEQIMEIPLEHLVLETDSPYLTPTPFRGKRNESAYVKYVAISMSEKFGLSIEEVSRITTKNALQLFNLL